MEDSNRRVVQFLEKEIKTYAALALFLSREGAKVRMRIKGARIPSSPNFYMARINEAKKLVNDLRKPN
jgi:hypothetical protein